TLLGLAPRALRGERTLPRELGRARGFLRLSRRSSEFVLRGLEATTRIPLLRDERTKARLLFGDAPFRGTDLLAERVAHADRGAAALLHRRRLEARFLGALRSGVVRIDGYLLAALGCRKDIGGGISRRRSDLAVARQLFATREELGTLALDRAGARLLCAHEIADVRFRGRELIGCDLGVAPRALGGGKPLVGLFAPALGVGALRENVALRALRRDELLVQPRSHRGELRGGVALGALPRVDDAREARQHEQTARRDHLARTEALSATRAASATFSRARNRSAAMRLRSRSRWVRSFVRLAADAASSSSRARSDRSSSPRRSSSLSLTRCARSVSTRAARASA